MGGKLRRSGFGCRLGQEEPEASMVHCPGRHPERLVVHMPNHTSTVPTVLGTVRQSMTRPEL